LSGITTGADNGAGARATRARVAHGPLTRAAPNAQTHYLFFYLFFPAGIGTTTGHNQVHIQALE
jgi:hypothetical protein